MNLLILSYVYAPDRSPRAYRWTALAEFWASQGHRIDVVSAWKHNDKRLEERGGVTVHRVGGDIVERLRGILGQASHRAGDSVATTDPAGSGFRRAAKALYRTTLKKLFWPDYAFHWYFPAVGEARALCRTARYDAVISVSHPFTPHLVGLALKRRSSRLRWLVDIGDPFSLLDEIPLNNTALYGGLNRRAEAAVLERADAVSVTVERCRADFAAAFPASAGKITVIPPLLSLPAQPSPSGTPFANLDGIQLVFIGTLYRGLRDPAYLIALFKALRQRRPNLQLHFFGALNDCSSIFDLLGPALGTSIHLHGTVPREQIVDAMRDADVLINIGNVTPHQLPSKLVEYVAAARPILNVASSADDTAAMFLADYPAALTVSARADGPDEAAVESVLAFIAAPPAVAPAAVDHLLAPYRLERVAAAYFDLLESPASPR